MTQLTSREDRRQFAAAFLEKLTELTNVPTLAAAEFGVVGEGLQGPDGAVGAGVAEAALFAHAARARIAVVAIRVHELGGGEHGLVVPFRSLTGGARVATILAFVVGDDALEAVLGVVGAGLQYVRLRGLDADAQVDQRIDVAEVVILFFHNDLAFGWGMSIVALTFATRLLILPLSIKQIRSMRELQAIQPQMKEIQTKYKQDRQRTQKELMKLYQEHGVNPFASCFPLLLQLPVFLALFWLLRSSDFENAVSAAPPEGWLFINSLIQKPEGTELIVLLVLFIATQFGAGLVMMSRLQGPQRAITFILPLVIAPFIISFPAGLALYWITTNIWTLGQQYVVTRVAPPVGQPAGTPAPAGAAAGVQAATAPAAPPPPPPRKRKRRSGKRR